MAIEPALKRASIYVDGQNLFRHAKDAFGYSFPNYDIAKLAQALCASNGWNLASTHFYTGIPDPEDDAPKHAFWTAKLSAMGRSGVRVYSRPLRYRNQRIRLPDGSEHTFLKGEEKGIDIRVALDIISGANVRQYDVAVVFSQDQDLSGVAKELRVIAAAQERWIKMYSAFPSSPTATNRRGIDRTDWIRILRADYDKCLDPKDYRPGRRA